MLLLTVCLLVQSVMLGLKVSVTQCKEWANLELRGIALTEVKSQ